jgi:hypothetical protein
MNLANGLKELLVSPSGLLSLLCLAVLTFLTLKLPALGWAPVWCSFFGLVPVAMGYFEHLEQMAQIANQQASVTSVVPFGTPPGVTQVIDNIKGRL